MSFDEWRDGTASGEITEAFACGTAAVITPIGTVRFDGGDLALAIVGHGELAAALRKSLVDIQRGRVKDKYGWVHRVS